MRSELNSVIFLVVIAFLYSCNPYHKPGTRGTIPVPDPQMWNAGQNAILTEDNIMPDSLPCDEIYCLTIRSSEVAMNCENYNFTVLYNKAVDLFNHKVSQLRCLSTDCDVLQTKTIFQSAVCHGRVATVIMKFEIKCIKNDVPDQTGLPFRLGAELTEPFKDSFPVPIPEKDETILMQFWNDVDALECPYDFEFKTQVIISVPSCDEVRDYTPFIQKAETMAHKIWDETRCITTDGCHKHDLQEVGLKWDCRDNKIWVEYWFKVPCSDE